MNDNFCSDIVALFWNHLWECPLCWFKVFLFIAIVFFLSGFLYISVSYIVDKFFNKKYKELESDFEKLNDSYSDLLVDYENLCIEFEEYLNL